MTKCKTQKKTSINQYPINNSVKQVCRLYTHNTKAYCMYFGGMCNVLLWLLLTSRPLALLYGKTRSQILLLSQNGIFLIVKKEYIL